MKHTRLTITLAALLFAACGDYDDFAFTGTVVDYEMCNGLSEMGYAVALSAPDSIGAAYTNRDGETSANTVVIYGSDRLLYKDDQITGRIYIDNNYSKSTCSYHYTDRDVPEAVFTELKKL